MQTTELHLQSDDDLVV